MVLFHLSACSFPSQASLLIQGQISQEHTWYLCMHTMKSKGVTIHKEKPGPMVAGSQWVNDSWSLSLDRRFCIMFHRPSWVFYEIQQPATRAGACTTTHYLCTGSTSFPASLCVASISSHQCALTKKMLTLRLYFRLCFLGTQAKRGLSKTSV